MYSKIIGYFLLIITILLYIYYTLWVYLKPFLNKNNFLNNFFFDKYWAIAIPCYGACIIYTIIMIFIGLVFILSYKYEEEKTKNE